MIPILTFAAMAFFCSLLAIIAIEDQHNSRQIRYAFAGMFMLAACGFAALMFWQVFSQ